MQPKPCCGPPQPSYLPITTGRVGLSQTTGGLEFYGHNYHGRGIQLFRGTWQEPRWCPPQWAPPVWGGCSGGCSCGGGGCPSCCDPCLQGANCFAQLLTDPRRWVCYYAQQSYVNLLTNPAAWQSQGAA